MASLLQMNYALAVETYKHFGKAAEACSITQPTLSVQLQKLEEELGATLFDRSRKPVTPTQDGLPFLLQFRKVVREYERIEEMARELSGNVTGMYRLGIIPTMAPYVLPKILGPFGEAYPEVELRIEEITTNEIIHRLTEESLDGGILATPLEDKRIVEFPIFRESFVIYHSPTLSLEADTKGRLRVDALPLEKLIIMQEGHCMRTQTLDLCALGKRTSHKPRFVIEAGSMTTLCNMVNQGPFFTVLPALAALDIEKQQQGHLLKQISGPTPFRQVSLVTHRAQTRAAIRNALLIEAKKQLIPFEHTERYHKAPVPPQ